MKNKIYLLSLLAFVLLIFFGFGIIIVRNNYPTLYLDIVKKYSVLYDVDQNLVMAMIKQESDFNPNAESSAGAIGLMQLLPETCKWISEQNDLEFSIQKMYEPDYNIQIGIIYIKYLYNRFPNDALMLCAYNAGENIVGNWVKSANFSEENIPYGETKNFVRKVKKYRERYKFILEI